MGAFATGFETGLRQSEAGQQEKQGREDLLFQTKVQNLANTRNALQAKYSATLDKEGKPTEATQGILDQLRQNAADIRELYHPDKNPGAIERFGHLLTDALHITKPAPKIETEVGAINIPAGVNGGAGVPANPAVAAVAQKFPRYASYLGNVVVQPVQKQTDDRQVEFYPPWESENPNPGKLTIQPYRDELASGAGLTKTVSGELLHYIGGVNPSTGKPIDPEYQKLKQAVAAARTPQQVAQDKAIYQDQVKNHGETRAFDQWFNQSRLDEYVMGYVTPDAADEWRKNGWYKAPQMAKAVEAVKQYLSTPASGATGAPSIEASAQAIHVPGQKVTIAEVPQKQFDKQQALQAKNLAADREAAQQAAAGAPIGPLQEAVISANADATKWLGLYQAKVNQLKQADPNMSPEEAQQSALELMGVRIPISYGQPQLWQLADGTQAMVRFSSHGEAEYADGTPLDPAELGKGAKPLPKPSAPSHAILAQEEDAYAKSYGFPDFSSLPASLQYAAQQYVMQRAKLDTQFGHATRTTKLTPDKDGNEIPVTFWNYSGPAGAVIPVEDPLSRLYQPGDAVIPITSPRKIHAAPSRPSAHVPRATNSKAAPTATGNPYVKVGASLFQSKTPEYTKVKEAYDAAYATDQLAQKALRSDNATEQKALALKLIKSMANRVQMTEYKLYTSNMGVANTVEGMVNAIVRTGQLPTGIIQNLANLAHDDLLASKSALDLYNEGHSSNAPATNQEQIDSIVDSLNGR